MSSGPVATEGTLFPISPRSDVRILVFCVLSLSSLPPWLLIVIERTCPSRYSQATADFPSASVMTTPRPSNPSTLKGYALFSAATLSKLLDPSPGTPIADAVW